MSVERFRVVGFRVLEISIVPGCACCGDAIGIVIVVIYVVSLFVRVLNSVFTTKAFEWFRVCQISW